MGVAVLSLVQNLFALVFAIAFIVLLIQRNPNFLRLYQIMSIISIVIGVVVIIAAGVLASDSGIVTTSTAIFTVLFAVLFLVLFTMYFCKSVRMRTYMGSTEYIDRALFKVGA